MLLTGLSSLEAYRQLLPLQLELDSNLVVLTADLGASVGVDGAARQFPERFIDVGIAEQNLFGVSAGLALEGMRPIAHTFAVFASLRAADQLRTSIAWPNLPVTIVATNGGLAAHSDGASHQAIEDIAVVRAIPNLMVVAPADGVAMNVLLPQVLRAGSPVYLRLSKIAGTVYPSAPVPVLRLGTASYLREGTDVTLIGTGDTVTSCLSAAKDLSREGIDCGVLDMHTIKPLDSAAVRRAAQQTRRIVVVENHSVIGGLGSSVAEVVAGLPGCKATVCRLGIADTFCESGDYEELLSKYRLDVKAIAAAAADVL